MDERVQQFFDAFQEEARALVDQKILPRDDASAIASAFARIAASVARSESTRREPTPIGLFWQTADGRWHFSPGSLKRGDIHDNGRPIHIALLGEEAK
jgi:hypothetical protein